MAEDLNTEGYYDMEERPGRNGFTTFWLYLLIVAQACLMIYYLNQAMNLAGFIMINWTPIIISIVVFPIITIAGLIMLLMWKKVGYYVVVAGQVLGLIYSVYLTSLAANIFTVMQVGIYLLVLWAVLQIKKDGVSCWSQLR